MRVEERVVFVTELFVSNGFLAVSNGFVAVSGFFGPSVGTRLLLLLVVVVRLVYLGRVFGTFWFWFGTHFWNRRERGVKRRGKVVVYGERWNRRGGFIIKGVEQFRNEKSGY